MKNSVIKKSWKISRTAGESLKEWLKRRPLNRTDFYNNKKAGKKK